MRFIFCSSLLLIMTSLAYFGYYYKKLIWAKVTSIFPLTKPEIFGILLIVGVLGVALTLTINSCSEDPDYWI